MTCQTGKPLHRARCLVCSPRVPPSPNRLPAGLAPAEAMLLHYSRNAEPAPRRARPGGSNASALQPERRTGSPPGSPRRKQCFCTTAGTPNRLPAGLAPAEAMLLHYSRNAEPAPRRARPGGSNASALQPERRTGSPPGSPRRKPCFCTTAETPDRLPAGPVVQKHGSAGASPAPTATQIRPLRGPVRWVNRGSRGQAIPVADHITRSVMATMPNLHRSPQGTNMSSRRRKPTDPASNTADPAGVQSPPNPRAEVSIVQSEMHPAHALTRVHAVRVT